MNHDAKAQRLLYALSDVRNTYIEEAACWKSAKARRADPKALHFSSVLRFAAVAAACAVLVFAGVHTLKPNAQVSPEPLPITACNPMEEVSSMDEAKALVGFGLTCDALDAHYAMQSIVLYDGTLLEVSFAARNDSDAGFAIRKAKTAEDISGDYTDYDVTRTVAYADFDMTLKGEDAQWWLATWHANGYAYALTAQGQPLSTEEIRAIIEGID